MAGLRSATFSVVLAGALVAGLVGVTPQAAAQEQLDSPAFANVMLGGYLRVAGTERDYVRRMVTSAELLDWRDAHPNASEGEQAEHAKAVQQAIALGVPEQTWLAQQHEMVGASISAIKPVPGVSLAGARVDGIVSKLVGRNAVAPDGDITHRLKNSFGTPAWIASFEDAQASVFAGVGDKARADAGFANAWNAAVGTPAGISATASATEIAEKPQVLPFFNIEEFKLVQHKPNELKLVTEQKTAQFVKDLKEQRTSITGDIKVVADAHPPGKNTEPTEEEKKAAQAKHDERQKYIDGGKTALDAVAFVWGFLGDKKGANDIRKFANGLAQIATAANKLWTAFKLINSVFSMATVAFTGNIVGAISTIIGLFGAAAPSVEEMILAEIKELRKEVEKLRKEMHEQFDRMDKRLTEIYTLLDAHLYKLEGSVSEVKHLALGVSNQVGVMDARVQLISRTMVESIGNMLKDSTIQQASNLIDFSAYHPGERITKDQYRGAENTFKVLGVTTAHAPPFVAPTSTGHTYDDARSVLDTFGPGGAISYLASYARGSHLDDDFPAAPDTGNPDAWMIAAKAFTLLSDQNADHATEPPNAKLKAVEVLDAGRKIVEDAKRFSTPDPGPGKINKLFSNLMNRYLVEHFNLYNNQYHRERQINNQGKFDLWGGAGQPVPVQPDEEGPADVDRCGIADQKLPRASNVLGWDLPQSHRFAIRNLPILPKYEVCWNAYWTDEATTVADDRCDPGTGGVTVPCKRFDTVARPDISFRQRVSRSDAMGGSIQARDVLGPTSDPVLVRQCWDIPIHNCNEYIRDVAGHVRNNWGRGKAVFERFATDKVDILGSAWTTVGNGRFLTGKKADYYQGTAEHLSASKDQQWIKLQVDLLQAYTELGFPRALRSDQNMRALLYGTHALHGATMDDLVYYYAKAAENTRNHRPAWENGHQEPENGDCGPTPELVSADPLAKCMAWSARQRVVRLSDRYFRQFSQRAAAPSSETLPEVQDHLRELYLVTARIHPGRTDLGPVVDPVPPVTKVDAAYDGDGTVDVGYWRPSDGQWYVEPSSGGDARTFLFGQFGDLPVPADYDRDGRAELAVVRPEDNGMFARTLTSDEQTRRNWARPDYQPTGAELNGMSTLAGSLTALGHQFWNTGRGGETVRPLRYARDIRRRMAQVDPGRRAESAESSVVLSQYLSFTGQHAEAVTIGQEGVSGYREIGDRAGTARALGNLTHVLWQAGRHADAVVTQRESRDIWREVAATDPRHKAGLAYASVVFGSYASMAGVHDEALPAAAEGVALYRELGERPAQANALHSQANVAWAAGKHELAITAQREARDLYRELASSDPAHKVNLATASAHLGSFLSMAGQHDEAITVARESVALFRELNDQPGLAFALVGLAHRLVPVGQRESARAAAQEAVEIYERLVAAHPGTYYSGLLADATRLRDSLNP
ncbi:tetratricopeptide repeat protein [Herbihabitans rhizosphaerae]|uniref:Tetratricopeptide repeat protein n=1 Tax=Herbihabitans rhizosphaerae TaxID=1872711 RepID=A0A4V2ESB4_9PSEU|nr:tetratricopeptide repeat protein [Herbihabitans rhizosphaerae]RZS36983.1 tetratricopeptide repeat protein [Herbihabitans rhizosphaerae]